MKPLFLKFVNKGVANRFELKDHDLIEMNWRLKMYPELFYRVLIHELKHGEENNTIDDLAHDMKSRTPGLFKFMRNHISTWTQLLPFYWDRKKKLFIYDYNAIASWIIMLSIMVCIYLLMPLIVLLLGWGP